MDDDGQLTLRYSTFSDLNTPLHFATVRGHVDDYCGQVDLCDFSLSYASLIFVRPLSGKASAFRFLPSKVSEMEARLQHLNNIPSRAVLQSLTDKFSASPECVGRVAIQPCQGGDPLLGLQSTVAGVAKTPPPRMVVGSLPSCRERDHLRISSALDWHSLGVIRGEDLFQREHWSKWVSLRTPYLNNFLTCAL